MSTVITTAKELAQNILAMESAELQEKYCNKSHWHEKNVTSLINHYIDSGLDSSAENMEAIASKLSEEDKEYDITKASARQKLSSLGLYVKLGDQGKTLSGQPAAKSPTRQMMVRNMAQSLGLSKKDALDTLAKGNVKEIQAVGLHIKAFQAVIDELGAGEALAAKLSELSGE
jgi:hypothetical protein